MNNAIYHITLDVHSTLSQTVIAIPLGDNARTIKITLSNNGIPYEISQDCSAQYRIKTPDETVFFGDCSIVDSVISFDLTSGVTGSVGIAEAEIVIVDGNGKQLTSPRFSLRIDNTLYSEDEVEAEDEAVTLPQTQRSILLMNNPSVYRITLDLHETMSKHMLDIKKGDNLRRIEITLAEDGEPYLLGETYAAVLRAKKPDGTILYNYCHITEDSKAIYDFTNQTSAVTGLIECELTVYDNGEHKLSSPTFFLRIADTLYSDSEVESQDEFTALTEAISETNNLDIEVEKEGHTATVTVTHKDGTESSVEIYDGTIEDEVDPTVPNWAKQPTKPEYDASEISFESININPIIANTDDAQEAISAVGDYVYFMTPATIGAVPTRRKVNGKALSQDITLNASDVGALPSSTVIPSKTSDLTNDSGYITISDVPTPPVASVNGRTGAVIGLAEASSLATVATTGDYDDLIDKPTIPTATSDLTNDSGFITSSSLATVATTGSYNDLTDKPTIPTVPTNVSAFTNDAGYLVASDLTEATDADVIAIVV